MKTGTFIYLKDCGWGHDLATPCHVPSQNLILVQKIMCIISGTSSEPTKEPKPTTTVEPEPTQTSKG